MIRIAVLDDDPMILNQINKLISVNFSGIFSVDLYSDSMAFYNNSNKCYDLIFLDIDMPNLNGFEIAEAITLLKNQTAIVFVSNLEHLVYDSLKFRPFRFVRKSSLDDDITSAINDFIIEFRKNQDMFLINTSEMTMSVMLSDIVCFESMGHNIFAETADGMKHLLTRERDTVMTMKSLTEQFESKGFIRVHKSYLVNYRYIYVIKSSEVVLKTNETILINPHNRNAIKNRFQQFVIEKGGV
ncbi:MAG: LytTR family DNA-binding domain-containing protein [Ruminococcus flavefaciens]|nr:LytTR family DNA-binding domain-containing protein [Ruminococcus flavefaciens]MCM1229310.1 LytTR family DNA-binding domain-containing protein [Ruminococcus flavefaciens]